MNIDMQAILEGAEQNMESLQQKKIKPPEGGFPMDAVPKGFFRDYIDYYKTLTEASDIFHFAAVLSAVSTVLGKDTFIEWGANRIYPNFYLLVIGESGISRKSTAIGEAEKLLHRINPDYKMYDSFSTEALLEALEINPTRFIFFDEFKQLTDLEGKSYGKGLISFLTRAWACPENISVGFKNIPVEKRNITGIYLTLLSATTMDWFAINKSDITGGFLGRFLPILSGGEKRLIPRPPRKNELKINGFVKTLAELSVLSGEVTMSDDAGHYYDHIYCEDRKELNQFSDGELLKPFFSRLGANILKMAMVFQLVKDGSFCINKDTMVEAVTCLHYIKECYVDLVVNKVVFSKEMGLEKKIIEIVKKDPGIKHRELAPRLHTPAKEYRPAIESLIDKGFLRYEEDKGYYCGLANVS
ncbi:MAG: DUF3987 domain-containing protein [Candidatus Tantalella remota]|nr:DUF3987 domain-containing protein [Candidatus Tantalella remota]